MSGRKDTGEMPMRPLPFAAALSCVLLFAGGPALAQHHGHHAPSADTRALVHFPPALVEHTLANMRDHLAALQEISEALAGGRNDQAAKIAEDRLGMSSLQRHGAHDVAKFMPHGMRDAGTAMHRAASRFAIEAQNAGATGDLKPALGALGQVMSACVGCHAGYRLK
jgi:hypothetical protein